MSAPRADRRLLLGVFLVCFANLQLEVVTTRLFSATMFYHFTFLAIALALFGVAASGVYVFVGGVRFQTDVDAHMAKAARRFAIFTFAALVYAMTNPIDIIIVTGGNAIPELSARQVWQLMLLVGVTAVPFFFSGLVVSVALAHFRADTGRIYAWDLAGAALATVATGIALAVFGGPSTVLVTMVIALVGAALFQRTGVARWIYVGAAAALLAWNLASPIVIVPTAKGVKVETTELEAWNSFSRVTVDTTRTIKIDASAATHIEDLEKLKPGMQLPEISALAHAMLSPPARDVLVIGPGGGRDVLHALAAGAAHVTGVEVNPIIADTIMGDRYRAASHGLYADPRVTIVVDDGRSFVRRSDDRYDILQASLVDTWAATAAGAFALSENALYTREAFDDYLDHVTDRGAVTMTRWHTGAHGETARLLLLAAAALEHRGVATIDVRKHLVYAFSPKAGVGTMILKRTPIAADELARVAATCAAQGFTIAVSPTGGADAELVRFLDAGPDSALVASQQELLSPPTDDRPFFFYGKKADQLWHPKRSASGGLLMNDPALWIAISLGSVLLLSIAFIVAPLAIHWRRRRTAAPRHRGAILGYFGLVGFAFMMVEVALLQRFTLFLGHPSYALLVTLCSLLAFTAAGAYASSRIADAKLGRTMLAAGLALAALACASAFAFPPLLGALVGLPIAARIAIAVALIAPSGLAMGAMIPSVIRALSSGEGAELVAWGWGVNGATSVVGTVAATVIALYCGFTVTFLVGAVCYAAAGVLGAYVAQRSRPRSAASASGSSAIT